VSCACAGEGIRTCVLLNVERHTSLANQYNASCRRARVYEYNRYMVVELRMGIHQ
jgi:hypothetical protein